MTPERVVALLIALVPVLAIIASIVIAIINRPKDRKANPTQDQQQPAPADQPALGVTVDDHADDAIAALTDSRDLWKGRAEEYRDRLTTANGTLREHGLPLA